MKRFLLALLLACTVSAARAEVPECPTCPTGNDGPMARIDSLLSGGGAFFLATADGDQPKLRPLGAHHLVDGTLWFGVGEFKNVYRQLAANPKCEIVSLQPGGSQWLRYTGRAVFAEGEEREKLEDLFLAAAPGLKAIYDKKPGHRMMCFHLDDARAELVPLMPPGEVLFDNTAR